MRYALDYLKPLVFMLAGLAMPGVGGSAAQPPAVVSGRVEMGIPVTARPPSTT